MDQNQSSWQPISHVLDQKLTGEDTPDEKFTTPPLSVTPDPNAGTSQILSPTPTDTSLSPHNLVLLEKLTVHLAETAASLTEFVNNLKGEAHSIIIPSVSAASNTTPAAYATLISTFSPAQSANSNAARVLEGVFDGMRMVGADGVFYPVPPNYASKSKLVEGDLMKLTITPNGAFIYKQIGPIKRKRLIGELLKRQDGDTVLFDVLAQDHVYHVLSAAVTYYKGEHGDEAAIFVPEDSPSKWAAVEYIVKKSYATNI